jgi:hypothetical protein
MQEKVKKSGSVMQIVSPADGETGGISVQTTY